MNPSSPPAAALAAPGLTPPGLLSTTPAPSLLSQLGALLRDWRHRGRSRRELRELDDHLLKDIGLSRAQVVAETDKPFWRA